MRKSINIPKSFRVFNSTVNVTFDSKNLHNDNLLGESDYCTSEISLATEFKGVLISEDVIKDTFYHEKVHHILDAMREYELSQNEKFVEVFSKLLRQSEETAEYILK